MDAIDAELLTDWGMPDKPTERWTGRLAFSPCAMCGERMSEVIRSTPVGRHSMQNDVSQLYHACILPYPKMLLDKPKTCMLDGAQDKPVDRDPADVARAKSWFQDMPEPWRSAYGKLRAARLGDRAGERGG